MAENLIDYIYANTIDDYIAAGIYFFGTILGFIILQKFINSKILKDKDDEQDERSKRRIEAVIKGIDTFLSLPLVSLIGLFFALKVLIVPNYISWGVEFFTFFAAAYYLMKGSFTILDYILAVTKEQTEKKHILDFLRFMIRTFILVLVGLWLLSALGLDITAFLAGFGILGLGFAFALQNVIADLFASITIYLDKPFEIGDSIKIGSDIGTVEKIGLKSTHLRTPLGNQLIISNRDLTNQRIHNMKRMETRRVELIIGVAYETPHDKLQLIPEEIQKIVESFKDAEFNWVFLTEFGASTLNFKLLYTIKTKDAMVWLKTQQAINLAILSKLDEMSIELPYPIQKVVIDK